MTNIAGTPLNRVGTLSEVETAGSHDGCEGPLGRAADKPIIYRIVLGDCR
jgi:hypothetical protein